MRKITSLLLALALVLTLSTAAFATSFTSQTGTGSVGIAATYEAATDNKNDILTGAEGTKVYSLTLSWNQSGTIKYNAGKTNYSWNSENLEYDSKVTGKGWTVSNAYVDITAVNRGNRDVQITCGTPAAITGLTITGSYDNATFTVASAATNGFTGQGATQSGSARYTISKVSGDSWNGSGNIGTITVTIAGQ